MARPMSDMEVDPRIGKTEFAAVETNGAYAVDKAAFFVRLLTLKVEGARRQGNLPVAGVRWEVRSEALARATELALSMAAEHFLAQDYEAAASMQDNSYWFTHEPHGIARDFQPATEWTGTLEVTAPDC